MKIVVSEFMDIGAQQILRSTGAELIFDPALWQRRGALLDGLAGAQALIVRNQTRVDGELLAAGRELKVVGRLGVGLDNLDLSALRAAGVTVCAARSANAIAVSEYVMAAILNAARRLVAADLSVRGGNWDRQGFTGFELYGKTLGIVGAGDIGMRLAIRARAFGMHVVGFDPLLAPYTLGEDELGIHLTTLDEVVATSDFISLHLPLLPATHKLFDAARLAAMKPGAWLINSSRGGIVDEAALAWSLGNRHLGGAVLDVLEQEPPAGDHPLRGAANCILTPHVAGLTQESGRRVGDMVARDVLRALSGGKPFGLVP